MRLFTIFDGTLLSGLTTLAARVDENLRTDQLAPQRTENGAATTGRPCRVSRLTIANSRFFLLHSLATNRQSAIGNRPRIPCRGKELGEYDPSLRCTLQKGKARTRGTAQTGRSLAAGRATAAKPTRTAKPERTCVSISRRRNSEGVASPVGELVRFAQSSHNSFRVATKQWCTVTPGFKATLG